MENLYFEKPSLSYSVSTRTVNIHVPERRVAWTHGGGAEVVKMDNITEGTWESLPVKLNDNILETLREMKFTHMTPVQVRSHTDQHTSACFSNHLNWSPVRNPKP